MDKWQLGQTGEELAADWLSKNGFQILHHNWNLHHGCELDLVAMKNHELHFIEVKTRSKSSELFGAPEQAIDMKKLRHIGSAIAYYMSTYHLDNDFHVDAISVIFKNEKDYLLKFIPDINYFSFG